VKAQFPCLLTGTVAPYGRFCSTVLVYSSGARNAAAPRLYERVADAVGAQIQAGIYRPGERIPSVRRLRDQHHVSLTTVLEAVRVLESRGLVRARPQSGYFVREPHGLALGEPDPSSPPRRPSRVDASLALKLNLGIGNPTGSCMTDEAKRRLVGLLETHDVPLVEDDVYGDLVFGGPRPRAVKAFDRHGLVLYCGSYSKTLSPGLRVGWAIPGRYQDKLELLKLVVNQATAPAPQLAVAAFVESGGFDRHLRRVRHMYRDQMEHTIRAVTRYFPNQTRVTRPAGGHVLWVQLPAGVDSMDLYEAAGAAGIRIAPGPMFSPSGGYRSFIRLNTGFPWQPALERQIETLGKLAARAGASGPR